ncbi:MAG: UDP-N-acetylmuramate--alanine ligase [Tannerellaceae bacterium]|jgi:UDP-N-acetylmuramate: L-alanyl-gamma-D-glutamyl-meso-diaminopimelate ligase|nr:UDP-N-acetylmuramate--alanine ligase [Tannerellaceae bacterium]
MLDLAVAIKGEGYDITASGDDLTEAAMAKLRLAGCVFYGNGWFPDRLMKSINFVVLGTEVKRNNPELLRAKELGLLILSIPEFIFERTKEKTRVVVAGSQGKKSIISMIVYALNLQKLKFDYALTSEIAELSSRVKISFEARIAIIEGDEHVTSKLEKRFQLEFYRPHIAVLTNLIWTPSSGHTTPEKYPDVYRSFISSIKKEGKLIYYSGDKVVNQLAEEVRDDITAIPYEQHAITERNGETFLQTRYGDYQVRIPDAYFLINLNAARLVSRQLGVKDTNFYQAMSDYSLSSFL